MDLLKRQKAFGFTLAELLSALAILGIIATFTIPKVLSSSQNNQWNSQAKEVVGSLSGAFTAYNLNSGITATTTGADLTPYLNYVRLDTASTIDGDPAVPTTRACDICIKTHGGGLILLRTSDDFSSGQIRVWYDPDGTLTTNNDSLAIFVKDTGRIHSGADVSGDPMHNPSWFSW